MGLAGVNEVRSWFCYEYRPRSSYLVYLGILKSTTSMQSRSLCSAYYCHGQSEELTGLIFCMSWSISQSHYDSGAQ
jgi:hypothetical protein